jgi:hypothetical protein
LNAGADFDDGDLIGTGNHHVASSGCLTDDERVSLNEISVWVAGWGGSCHRGWGNCQAANEQNQAGHGRTPTMHAFSALRSLNQGTRSYCGAENDVKE